MTEKNIIVDLLFPTVVGVCFDFLSDEQNQHVIERCYDISKGISLSHDSWLSMDKSPSNSFRSYALQKDPEFDLFFNQMNSFVQEFAKINDDNSLYKCSHSWFNIYNKDQYQEPHFHKSCVYSVVYYAKVPENSGKIVFMNPKADEIVPGCDRLATSDSWQYSPKSNTAIIFRSNLSHFVLHGQNEDDRISIASNYILDPKEYNKNFYETDDFV